MALQNIERWRNYLTTDDYDYLFQYIENIKNGILNDKMIILAGPSGCGKSTLKNNIQSYVGNEFCCIWPVSSASQILSWEDHIKPLGFLCGVDEIRRSKKSNMDIISLIKYKQSFIADTIHIERVYYKLLDHSRIIRMHHIFT